MGQKVNPLSLRLQYTNRHFDSSWYSDINYNHFLSQDLNIRKYLNSLFKQIRFSQGHYSILNSPKKSIINFFLLEIESRSIYLEKSFGIEIEKKIMRVKKRKKKKKFRQIKTLISKGKQSFCYKFKKKFVKNKKIKINFLNCFKKVEFSKKKRDTSLFFSNWFFFQKKISRKGRLSKKKNFFLEKKKQDSFSTKGMASEREMIKSEVQPKGKIQSFENRVKRLTIQPKIFHSILVDNPQIFGQVDLFNQKKQKTRIGMLNKKENTDFFCKKKKKKYIYIWKSTFLEKFIWKAEKNAKKKNATVKKNYKKKKVQKKTQSHLKTSLHHSFCHQFSREKAQYYYSKKLNYLTHLLVESRWISSSSTSLFSTSPLNKKRVVTF